MGRLHPGVTRFVNPHQFPVGLSDELHELKTRLVLDARGRVRDRPRADPET
jgi:nicotinate phosphoribosyltransferase